jgi:DNA repair protein REV1
MHGVGVLGSKLTLKVKQRKASAKEPQKFLGHGSCHNLSRSIDIPGGVPTNELHVFARLGMQLF